MEPKTSSQRKGNSVVHVREDSESDLENLFNPAALNQTTVPMRLRKLPPSFFEQPVKPPGQFVLPDGSKEAGDMPFAVSHARARSSPAQLNPAPHQQPTSQRIPSAHLRTQSYDALESESLPSGWEARMTATGQKYYVK